MNKLDQNREFFDKENFKKITGSAPVGGYYYSKVIGKFLLTFKHISNDKGVLSSDVCKCDLYFYISCDINGYKLDRMPMVIKSVTTKDIQQIYLFTLSFFEDGNNNILSS